MTNMHRQDKQVCLIPYQTLIPCRALKTVFMLSLHSNDSWMLKGVGFWLKVGVVSVDFVCKYWYELYNTHHRLSCLQRSFKLAGLADFQLFLGQKLHYCSARGGFNPLVLPKIAGNSFFFSPITSPPGPKPWGESQHGRR